MEESAPWELNVDVVHVLDDQDGRFERVWLVEMTIGVVVIGDRRLSISAWPVVQFDLDTSQVEPSCNT
jgi:hypothetical protein